MGKLTRNKVIINKTSLELLAELNVHAEKVGCVVMIGVLPIGTDLGLGKTIITTPHYMVFETSMFKDSLEDLAPTHVGFSKEDILMKLLGLAEPKGE
jgi:hypothetical protein